MLLVALLLAAANPDWNRPVDPFRIAGNLYYVGANEITSYLFVTPQGHILLDGGYEETAPLILANIANIAKIGYEPKDVKILINSQSHVDHAGGFAALKQATGAKLWVMKGDAEEIERGGLGDPHFADTMPFPKVKVDRVLKDGDKVTLGKTTLTAVLTAGHTPGCTTWTTTIEGKHVVFVCSVAAPGYKITPELVNEFRATFKKLAALPCDIFLGSHGGFFDLDRKRMTGEFVNPLDYQRFLERSQRTFEEQVKTSQTAAPAK